MNDDMYLMQVISLGRGRASNFFGEGERQVIFLGGEKGKYFYVVSLIFLYDLYNSLL